MPYYGQSNVCDPDFQPFVNQDGANRQKQLFYDYDVMGATVMGGFNRTIPRGGEEVVAR